MVNNFRGKNIKDTETAPETLITSSSFTSSITNNINSKTKLFNISNQQIIDDTLDDAIEKRK